MNEQTIRDLERRIQRLERTAVRYRAGEVTDVAPLDVALGGSDTSYEDVKSIGPLADGDTVATLLWGNDMLVLGALSRSIRFGEVIVSTSAATTGSAPVTHGVGATPSVVMVTSTRAVASAAVTGLSSTTFDVHVTYVDDSPRSTSTTVYWLAIG